MKLSKMTFFLIFFLTFFSIAVFSQNVEKLPRLKLMGRYDSNTGFAEGGAEIVTYNIANGKMYIANGAEEAIDVVSLGQFKDFALKLEKRIYVDEFFNAEFIPDGITSVCVSPDGEYVAIAIPNSEISGKGKLLITDASGQYICDFDTGFLPDMVTFTLDGNYILVANEGEPNDNYDYDPIGSVTIVELKEGLGNAVISEIEFGNSEITGDVRVFGPGSSSAEDFEPEYISVTSDSKFAFVSLQENNAIACVDIERKSLKKIYGLGIKDHSIKGNELDISDKDKKVNIKNWPVLGMYLPDGIAVYEYEGDVYVLTANEGDSRDYDGFSEETRVEKITDKIRLNAENYTGYSQEELDDLVSEGLFDKENMGRLKITTVNGYEDGVYEALYSYGARSFSIWKIKEDSIELTFDSGSDFENIIAQRYPDLFNCSNGDNKFDSRSDDKGPEPEDVKVGIVDGSAFAFIGLERFGGVMVYNITEPAESRFVDYINSRDFNVVLDDLEEGSNVYTGDIAPEGMCFINAENSPLKIPILLVANEVSGTVSVYSFE